MNEHHRSARLGGVVGVCVVVAACAAMSLGSGGETEQPAAQRLAVATQASLSKIPAPPTTTAVREAPAAAVAVPAPAPAPVPSPAPAPADPIAQAVAAQEAAAPVETQQPFDSTSYRPGPSLHTAGVLALVVEHFPADQVGNAMAVSRCESRHSSAIGSVNGNGTRDWGVFQLNDGGTLQAALRRIGVTFGSTFEAQQAALDADTNVRAARAVFDSRGWAPWTCAYKTGVVASLYGRAPGPMDGRYDERGLAGIVDLNRTRPEGVPLPTPTPPTPPTPTLTPGPSPTGPTPEPTPTQATPSTSPSASPPPSPSQSPPPSPSKTPSPDVTPPATASPTP